jgi:hypothetical protein
MYRGTTLETELWLALCLLCRSERIFPSGHCVASVVAASDTGRLFTGRPETRRATSRPISQIQVHRNPSKTNQRHGRSNDVRCQPIRNGPRCACSPTAPVSVKRSTAERPDGVVAKSLPPPLRQQSTGSIIRCASPRPKRICVEALPTDDANLERRRKQNGSTMVVVGHER